MVKVGIIGCGKITQRLHLPQYSSCKDAEVVALADIDKNLASVVAGKYGIKKVYENYMELVADKEVDAVSVCTPNHLHAEMVKACAEAGKHILVEKPIATTLEESDAMIQAARDNKVILMVEQTQRFDPNHEIAKEILEQEKLGRVLSVWGRIGHAGPEYWNPDCDWKTGNPWYIQKEKSGGGALIDIGVHIYDLIRWLVGKQVKEISGRVATLGKHYPVEDNAICHMEFDGGTIGGFGVSWTTRPYQVDLLFYGEKGTMKVAFGAKPPVMVSYGAVEGDPNCTGETFVPEERKESKLGGPCAYFVSCVEQNKQPFISGEEGKKTLEGILALYKSSQTGAVVQLPL